MGYNEPLLVKPGLIEKMLTLVLTKLLTMLKQHNMIMIYCIYQEEHKEAVLEQRRIALEYGNEFVDPEDKEIEELAEKAAGRPHATASQVEQEEEEDDPGTPEHSKRKRESTGTSGPASKTKRQLFPVCMFY